MRKIIYIALLLFGFQQAQAQELNCTVDVEFARIQTADPKIFQSLESAIAEFMNNRKWTNESFLPHEKINVSILINITEEVSNDEFVGEFIIQSERPVFNSNYSTVVYSYKDDQFNFVYDQFANFEYSDNNFLSNLTSMLAYYAYVVIGYDYDTFSPEGGTPYFLKAQDVIDAIPAGQKARFPGWSTFGTTRSRAVLINNLLNPRYRSFREAMFKMHLQGYDALAENVNNGRKIITEQIYALEPTFKDNPTLQILKVFFLAKNDELVSLYSKAPASERNKMIDFLSDLDPVNANKYKQIGK